MLINFNGKVIPEEQANIGLNRAMRFGDGLFETILLHEGLPIWLVDHIERLARGMRWLNIEFDSSFESRLTEEIWKLLDATKILKSGFVRIQLYRSGAGRYEPEENSFSFLISAEPMKPEFNQNKDGLEIGLAHGSYVHTNLNYSFKTLNALPYIRASQEKLKRGLGELVLLNEFNRITEGCASNIFLLKNNIWHSPPTEEGCLDGICRKNILKLFKEKKIAYEISKIESADLEMSEEVFFCNSVRGIQWVKAFQNKRYYHKKIDALKEELYTNYLL